MSDKARNRLVTKRDELQEFRDLCTQVHGRFGFKIITSSPSNSHSLEVWQHLAGLVIKSQEGHIPHEVATRWTEPFPSGSQCFWWWGSPKAVERFCRWADETTIALWEFRDSLPELTSGKGYFQTLPTLCEVALANNIGDPPLVINRVLLDTTRIKPAQRFRLPPGLRFVQPPPVFHIMDVSEDGALFALDVLDYLLGDVPRFIVDVAAQCVHWKGKAYPVTSEQAHFLDLLHKHHGKRPLTEAKCRAACPTLPNGHFKRSLKDKLPKPLRDITKSEQGKGWWLQLD